MTKPKVLICPYCGDTQAAGDRCRVCGGLFEPLSRQATHNAMGPWFIRNDARPFQPGCSYETVIKLVERGTVNKYSIIRSPTTKQFWTVAKHVPGIAHLLGYCHNCDASVDPGDHGCHACGVPFGAYLDRNFLGLPDVRPMPWEAPAGEDDASPQPTRQAFDFRRAAEPVGISSFASDEELRADGVEPISHYDPPGGNVPAFGGSAGTGVAAARFPMMPAASPSAPAATLSEPASLVEESSVQPASGAGFSGSPSGTGPSSAPAAATAPSGLATVMLETSPAGIAARAMQRRLDLQRRKIRTLTFAVFALAVILVVIVAVTLATRDDSARQEEGETQPAAKQTSPKEATPADRSKPAATPTAPASAPAAAAAPAATAAAEPASPKPDAIAERKAQLEEAQNLLAEARKNDRPAADRIRDYEAALKLLKAIAQKLPTEERPVDLDPTIRQAEQEMERLKLKEFFP